MTRRRDSVKARRTTKKDRIAELLVEGIDDERIAEMVPCKVGYVSVARRRLGIRRQPPREERANGEQFTPEYRTWNNMKNRCGNPKYPEWKYYGGRGIEVCARWKISYNAFLEDMGRRPSAKHSIDRRDNARGYEPGNCRWATALEQGRNKRDVRLITHAGLTQTLSEWAEGANMSTGTLWARLKLGWSMDRALSRPVTPAPLESHGEKRRSFKLAIDQVRAIRVSSDGTRSLALRYGVHKTTILNIRNGSSRGHVK